MITRAHGNLRASIDRHDTPTVTDIDHVRCIIDDHDHCGARAGPLGADLLTWHGVLGSRLCNFDKVEEAPLTFSETCHDRFIRELREVLILHDEVMKIVAEVVSTGRSTMTIEDSEEADLWPFNVQVCFALWLEDVENDRDPVLIVLSNDALVRVGSI